MFRTEADLQTGQRILNGSQPSETKSQSEDQENKNNNKHQTWLEVFKAYLEGKFRRVKRKLEKSEGAASEALKKLEGKLGDNIKLEDIKSELGKVSTELNNLDGDTHPSVIERKINELERLEGRLRKTINAEDENESKKAKATERKKKVRMKKLALIARELHRADLNSLPTHLQKQKLSLLDILKVNSQSFEKVLEENPSGAEKIFKQFEQYHKDLKKARREAQKEEKEIKIKKGKEELEVSEFAKRLKAEKKRYRNSAETKELLKRLENDEYLSPNSQKRLVALLKSHVEDLQAAKSKGEDGNDEQKAIAKLAKDIDLDELQEELDEIEDQTTNAKTGIDKKLKDKNTIQERQEIINENKDSLKKLLFEDEGDGQDEKTNLVEVFEQTNFEKQVLERMEVIATEESKDVIEGLEELQTKHMREFETQIRAEREGPLETRQAYAVALVKNRLVEEATDLDQIRKIYGTVTAGKFGKIQLDEDFRENLMTEVGDRFGITAEGVSDVKDTTGESDEARSQEKLDTDNEKASTFQKELDTRVKDILDTKDKSEQFVEKIENDKSEKQKFAKAAKTDLIIARVRKEYTNSSDRELQKFEEVLKENQSLDSFDIQKLISDTFGGKDTARQITEAADQVGELFEDENSFEVVASPAGLTIVFSETSKLNNAVFGDPEATESIAAVLENSDYIRSVVGEDWKGKISLLAVDGSNEDFQHEFRHIVNGQLDSVLYPTLEGREKKLKDIVEEMATKISTGELWMEMSLPEEYQDKLKLSLATLGYIDKDFATKNPEDTKKLLQILAMVKAITKKEFADWAEDWNEEDDDIDKARKIFSQNIYGEAIGNVLMSHRDENGAINLDAVIQTLKEQFKDKDGNESTNKFNLGGIEINEDGLEYQIFGLDTSSENDLDKLDAEFAKFADNKQFTFNVIPYKSLQSRPSRTQDIRMKGGTGMQPSGDVGIGSAVGGIVGDVFDRAFEPAARLFDFDKNNPYKPKRNPGPLGYHVGGVFNYAGTGKALQGIVRRVRNIPLIGLPLKLLVPDRRLVAATDARLFRAPPMGELNELIVKEYFPGLNKKLQKWFPGAPQPYENVNTTAGEVFNGHLNVIQETLGQNGLGLSNSEIQRIMGELPHVLNEPDEFGRPQNETSRNVFDKLEVVDRISPAGGGPEILVKKHRGRITDDIINGIDKYDLWTTDSNNKKIQRVEDLARHMKNVYTYDSANPGADNTFAYTMNDLMTASELVHDLGINPDNPSRIKSPKNDNYNYDRRSGLMIGEHTWYDPRDPASRGVLIQGERFDLKVVKQFIELYNNYHIYKALREGIPEVTQQMRSMEYLPNFEDSSAPEAYMGIFDSDGNVILPPGASYNLGQINFIPEHVIKEAIENLKLRERQERTQGNTSSANTLQSKWKEIEAYQVAYRTNKKTIPEINNRVAAQNPRNGEIKYYKLSPEKNKYYNPRSSNPYGFGGSTLPGFGLDLTDAQKKAIADNYLGIAKEDFGGWNDNMEKGLGFYDTWMSYYAAAKEYERKGKFASVFWGEISKWTGRIGNAVMLSSLITLSFTGAPLFAGILLGAGAYQFLVKEYVDHHAEVMKARRKKALEAIGSLEGRQSMFQGILQGKPPSKWELENMQQAILTMEGTIIEPMAAAGPEPGKAPNDTTNQFLKYIFGQDGLLPKQFAG